MTPGRFEDLRRVFLEGGSVQSWREAREAAQARKESRTESPLVQEVWGQLDRESIGRNPDFGPDVVAALEERYGRGIFARGKDATGQRAANLDRATQALAYRGLIPAESTADDLLRHLAFGDALNVGEQTFFQPTREDIRAGDEALKRDAAAWAGTVDGIAKAGVAPEQPVRMLSQTPLVMRLIGEDAVSKKIAAGGGVYAAPHVFDGTHPNMTPDMWKQLPEAMADPIAIFDTANPKHRGKGDIVFMVEIQDANGATVVVPVALDARGDDDRIRINILKSAYAKDDQRTGTPDNEWFKRQIVEKKNARYVNGQKLRRWQDSSGVQFPFTPLRNAAGNKVVTEADLVKLREANPTLYQTAYHGSPHRFSQFTLDHIGTGEGAQAHGWGLYFAREKNIANDYRERLRKGRSRGQLFEVDIPENDVLVDEQKSFSQQPDAVQKALRHIYRGFSGEQLRPVRDEQKARVRPDRKMLEEIHALELELQEVRRGRNALETINAEKPAGDARNPFGNASRFARWEENLKRLYTEEQRERLRNDPAFLEKEKAAKKEQFAALEAKIAEARDALQARVEKTRAAIDRADIDTLLEGMDGAELYSGLDIVTGSRREASLLLNANGIKGITYDGQQDGRCFVVFDDRSIETLNTFYQSASPDAFLAPEGSGAEPLVREGFIRKPDSAAAKVVRIEENAVPEFSGMKEFANWLKDALAEGGDVQISSTGQTARFTRTNVGASVKRSRSKDHRNAYAALREMVTNAEYDHYEKPDVRHPHGGGQDVYHAALEMGGVLYSVKIKLDVVSEDVKKARRSHGDSEIEDAHYKDHKLAKIEIAPALYRDAVDNQPFTQPADAISEVTLGVLRGSVKPSGIDGGMLYQEGGPSQARGAYVLRQDGAALIALFRGKADISTVIHEGAGHFFLENLREAAQLPDAPAWVTEGWRTVAGAIGADADPATAIATGAHETFARMAVDYMRSGRAPSDRLAQVFRRFARWLGAIWRRVRRRPDFAEVSPEVAAVMDRLLAAEEDIAATRERVAPLPETAPEGVNPEAWADYLRLARKAESDAAALLTLRRMAWERAVERAARKEARALRAEDPDQRRVGAFAACIPRVLDIQKSCVRCLAHDFFALF